MKRYILHLVVENLDLQDDEAMATISQADHEFYVSQQDSVVQVTAAFNAANGIDAACEAISALEKLIPGVRVVRLDADLVSASDIATRIGVSRQAVGHYVEGTRKAGAPFPQPLGWVGGGTRVWDWSSVVQWLRENVDAGIDDDDFGLNHAELSSVNAMIARERYR